MPIPKHHPPRKPPMQKPDIIQIAGPAGLLETIYLPAVQTPARGVAVINHPNPLQSLISARFSLLPAQPARRRQQRRHTRLRTRRNARLYRRHRLRPRATSRSRKVRIVGLLLRRLCRHLRRPRARAGFTAAHRRGSTPLHRPPRTHFRSQYIQNSDDSWC